MDQYLRCTLMCCLDYILFNVVTHLILTTSTYIDFYPFRPLPDRSLEHHQYTNCCRHSSTCQGSSAIDAQLDRHTHSRLASHSLSPVPVQPTPAMSVPTALPLPNVWDNRDQTSLSSIDSESLLQAMTSALQQRSCQLPLSPSY